MVHTENGDRFSRKCEMPVLHEDKTEGGPCESPGGDNGLSREVRMPEGRRLEDSTGTRRIQSVTGQEESESGSHNYETWIEVVEEIRIG